MTINDTIIPLSKTSNRIDKYESIISIEDFDLNQYNWCVHKVRNTIYAYRNSYQSQKAKQTIMMHRVILSRKLGRDLLPTEHVDHIDGNGLNNTRDNLRLATNSQNQHNARKQSRNSSGYKGVGWHKASKKWRARIMTSNGRIDIGYFDTPELAYEAYCKAAIEYHGEFARLE